MVACAVGFKTTFDVNIRYSLKQKRILIKSIFYRFLSIVLLKI